MARCRTRQGSRLPIKLSSAASKLPITDAGECITYSGREADAGGPIHKNGIGATRRACK